MDYFILRADGDQTGPYSLDQLRAMWASGQVNLDMAYWHEGMSEWQLLRCLETTLKPVPEAPVTQTPPVFVTPPTKESKPKGGCAKVAGFGCLGIVVLFGILIIVVVSLGQGVRDSSLEPTASLPSFSPPKEVTLASDPSSDSVFVLVDSATIPVFNRDMDVSNDPRIESVKNLITHEAENGALDVQIQALGKLLENTTRTIINQQLNRVETQYIEDGRGLRIPPGKYAVVDFYDENGNPTIPAPGNTLVWIAIPYNGKSVYVDYPMDSHYQ
jgi:hypothetical protein